MSGESIVNYRDSREVRYSAQSVDHAYDLILRDPSQVIRHCFYSNSLAKWHRPHILEEFKSELCLHLHSKFSGGTAFLELFNSGLFNYYLVTFTRNKLFVRSNRFTKDHGDRYESYDDFDSFDDLSPVHHDEEFEPERVRDLNFLDPDVIVWLLGTNDFKQFRKKHKKIFVRWMDLCRTEGRKVTIREASEKFKIEYRIGLRAISKISLAMKEKIQQLNGI